MIQRIQSVYLSLIVLISLLLFKGNLLVFTENTGFVINVTFNGVFRGYERAGYRYGGKYPATLHNYRS